MVKMQSIKEHSSTIKADVPKKDVHAKMEVFYNPLMVSNRDISILLLNSIENKKMNIALPLAGSGIRGLRFLKELKKDKINHLFVNDKKATFRKMFKENLEKNKLNEKNVSIYQEEASLFLMNQINNEQKPDDFCGYFDYIDIDPFGSPNPFLSAAIARISRRGIIAITSTDTAALSGTYPKVTKRKYWAVPLRNYLMHEIGLRILIRKVQLLGVQFEKALTPILSYHKDHYLRVYFKSDNGKTKCDEIIKQHQYFLFNQKTLEFFPSSNNYQDGFQSCGPLWSGKLFDKKLIKKMVKDNPFPEEQKFLDLLNEEKDLLGFYDLHVIAKNQRKDPSKMKILLKKLEGTKTHFSRNGIKTKKKIKEILKIIKDNAS